MKRNLCGRGIRVEEPGTSPDEWGRVDFVLQHKEVP